MPATAPRMRADDEDGHDDAVDVDARELRADQVRRHGADRDADAGAVEQELQREQHHERDGGDDDLADRHAHAADDERLGSRYSCGRASHSPW